MSMTREEAINWFEAFLMDYNDPMEIPDDLPYEVAQVALSALRPVSREQVEKVFLGCNECTSCKLCMWTESRKCHDCKDRALFTPIYEFCPRCGAPMTDEAVEMVIEKINKMEKLKNEH